MPYGLDISEPCADATDRRIDMGALDVDASRDGGVAALMPDSVTPAQVSRVLGAGSVTVSAALGRDAESVWLLNPPPVRVGRLRIVPAHMDAEPGAIRVIDAPAFGTIASDDRPVPRGDLRDHGAHGSRCGARCRNGLRRAGARDTPFQTRMLSALRRSLACYRAHLNRRRSSVESSDVSVSRRPCPPPALPVRRHSSRRRPTATNRRPEPRLPAVRGRRCARSGVRRASTALTAASAGAIIGPFRSGESAKQAPTGQC